MTINLKFLIGIVSGSIVGLLILLSIFLIYSYTDCYTCGFISIDYCSSAGGACPWIDLYFGVIKLLSLPFIFLMVLIAGFSSEILSLHSIFSFKDLYTFLSPLYILYWGFVGYWLQRTFLRKKHIKDY